MAESNRIETLLGACGFTKKEKNRQPAAPEGWFAPRAAVLREGRTGITLWPSDRLSLIRFIGGAAYQRSRGHPRTYMPKSYEPTRSGDLGSVVYRQATSFQRVYRSYTRPIAAVKEKIPHVIG